MAMGYGLDSCAHENVGRGRATVAAWWERFAFHARHLVAARLALVDSRLRNNCPRFVRHDDPPTVDGPSWDSGRISSLAHEVNSGTKPLAEITVRTADLPKFERELETCGALVHISPCGSAHTIIWLFKYPHILEVLKHLNGWESNPKVFETWVWGKAFGYSEAAIAEFICKLNTKRRNPEKCLNRIRCKLESDRVHPRRA